MKQKLVLSILFTFLCLCSSNVVLNGATGSEKIPPSTHKVEKQNTRFSILKKRIKKNIKKVFSEPKDKTKTGLGLALFGILSAYLIILLGLFLAQYWPAILLIGSICLFVIALRRSGTILINSTGDTEKDKKIRKKAMVAFLLSGASLLLSLYVIILLLV